MGVKQLAKHLLLTKCGPKFRHRIRRAYILHEIRHNRHYREPEMRLIRSLVNAGDFTFDIGANVGIYTRELALAVGPTGKVHSFEPVAENYDILTRLIRQAGFNNVFAYRMALGETAAECNVVIPDMAGFTGYYWAHIAKPGEKGKTESVEIRTIDELCRSQSIHRLDFVKCDVEGGELGVILGGRETIRSQHPGWLLEVSRETSDQVFKLLRDLGYRALVLDGSLQETECYLDRKFSNYFFLHPQSRCWERIRTR
jgi:FkbM family methyltransferase